MAKQKIILLIVIAVIFFGIISLGILSFLKPKQDFSKQDFSKQKGTTEEEKSEEKTSQEWIGEYNFNISSAQGIYPKFISGKFSKRPPDIKGGETFEASIKLEDPAGIFEVKLAIIGQEENLKQEIQLELVEGDEFSGVWQGSLIIPVEITQIFSTNFYAKNKSGKEDSLNLMW